MIQLNHGYRKRFTTEVAGIATAADSTPTAILYRNGSASGVTVTVSTTAETGVYLATFTTLDVGDSWAKTDHLELLISATIDGDAGYKAVLWDSDSDPDAPMRGTDNALLASSYTAPANGDIAAIKAKTDNLPNDPATLAKQDEILGAIGDIDCGGGGVTVNVLPAIGISADRSPGVTLKAFVGETITQSITLYQTNGTTPIVLTGKTLVIVLETRQGQDVATVPDSGITVSGDDDNVVTFDYPAAATSQERVLKFALRDAGSPNTVYLQGLLSVQRAPKVDV
jgi:hypothetical protein